MNTEQPENREHPESSENAESAENAENAERAGSDGGIGGADPAPATAPADGDVDTADGTRAARRRSRLAVVPVAAAVLLVGGGGAYLAANGGTGGPADASGPARSGATPPPLALDAFAGSYGVTYVARGELPAGPGSAPVYVPQGEVGKDAVARLAKALGVDGTPVAEGRIWRVGGKDGTGPSLTVNRDAPGSWTFSRYAPGTDDCAKGPLCTHDPMGPTGAPVSARKAAEAAAPVLRAAGLGDAKIDASRVMGTQRVVDADPVVGGLPTYGWTTGLTVGRQGELVGGHGLLGAPVKGATYPVLSAAKTLRLMNRTPKGDHRMGIGGCASPEPLKDRLERPCGASTGAPKQGAGALADQGEDRAVVDKAVFGLAAHSVAGRQTLVPSWLFEVRQPAGGGASTVTYPAVDPRYLAPVATPSAPAPSGAPRTVRVTGYTAEGRVLSVRFFGGVCADYGATAKESGRQVRVTVVERPWRDKVCVLIAKEYVKTVRLAAPLGSRTVIGEDGGRIAPRSGSPRP